MRGGFLPSCYLRVSQPAQIRVYIEYDPLSCTRQGNTPDEKDEEEYVGHQRREPGDLNKREPVSENQFYLIIIIII